MDASQNAGTGTPPGGPVANRLSMVLDTPALYYRAFYGLPASLKAPDGTPVNALRGLLDMMGHLLTVYPAARVLACWDNDWRPAFRTDLMPGYKLSRVGPGGGEETPEELSPQLPLIREALGRARVPILGVDGFEADDVIASVAEQLVARGEDALVVTGDRDLFQLIDAAGRIKVVYPGKSIRDASLLDAAALAEKYGVADGEAYAAMATLRGDPSDGLPGVAGVGEKTAARLIAHYGSVRAVVDAALSGAREGGLSERIGAAVAAVSEELGRAEQVVRTVRDLEMGAEAFAEQGTMDDAEIDAAVGWAAEHGAENSMRRFLKARSAAIGTAGPAR